MTAYTKEFEKWLNSANSNKEGNAEEDEDDQHEDEDFDNNIMATDDEDDEIADEDSSQSSFNVIKNGKSKDKIFENESAPILVDDDDDLSFEKQVFEDEPPILEPVPSLSKGLQISTLKRSKLQSSGSIRNYSRVSQTYSRQRSLQEKEVSIKTYEGREKFRHTMSDDFEKRRRLKAKDGKESGNIFDKFNSISESYDAPPPLIPSPEVLKHHSDVHSQDCKLANSPEICAMEADSTSEITADKEGSASKSNGINKNYRDVLIECDSTCMLGASPAIVSPASVSNGETEEVRDSGGGGSIVESIDCNESPGMCTLQSVENTSDSSTMEPLHQNSSMTNAPIQSGARLAHSFQQSFHTFTNTIPKNLSNQNEPPELEVIPQRSRYLSGSRRKRHTIDSWETYINTCKRQQSELSCPVQVESPPVVSTPPKLTHASETVDPCKTRIKRWKESSCHTKEGCLCSSRGKGHRRKGRRRHHTVPSEQPKLLDDSLHTFVVNSCILSKLQMRMHALLYELFPQVRTELEKMSPESLHFLELLSELVNLLQQPDDVVEVKKPSSYISSREFKESAANDNENFLSSVDAYASSHTACIPKSTPKDHKANTQHCDAMYSPVRSQRSPTSDLSIHSISNIQEHQFVGGLHQQGEKIPENDQDILQFSRLSLRDQKDSLPSVMVVLDKNPEAMITRFSQLSCKALQLLLPDLGVSLSNELAKSPPDLLVFLDNVLVLNATSKIKKECRK